jgi:predicted outer membrane repeat protein
VDLINNQAIDFGGAIYLENGVLTITFSNFINNTANNGGSIYLNNSVGNINFNRFFRNDSNVDLFFENYNPVIDIDNINGDYNWWGENDISTHTNIITNNHFIISFIWNGVSDTLCTCGGPGVPCGDCDGSCCVSSPDYVERPLLYSNFYINLQLNSSDINYSKINLPAFNGNLTVGYLGANALIVNTSVLFDSKYLFVYGINRTVKNFLFFIDNQNFTNLDDVINTKNQTNIMVSNNEVNLNKSSKIRIDLISNFKAVKETVIIYLFKYNILKNVTILDLNETNYYDFIADSPGYSLIIEYLGNEDYYPFITDEIEINIVPEITSNLKINIENLIFNQNAKITLNLSDSNQNPLNGEVELYINEVQYKINVSNGKAIFYYYVNVTGTLNISAIYLGSNIHTVSNNELLKPITINKLNIEDTSSNILSITVNRNLRNIFTIVGKLIDKKTNKAIVGELVDLYVNNKKISSVKG